MNNLYSRFAVLICILSLAGCAGPHYNCVRDVSFRVSFINFSTDGSPIPLLVTGYSKENDSLVVINTYHDTARPGLNSDFRLNGDYHWNIHIPETGQHYYFHDYQTSFIKCRNRGERRKRYEILSAFHVNESLVSGREHKIYK